MLVISVEVPSYPDREARFVIVIKLLTFVKRKCCLMRGRQRGREGERRREGERGRREGRGRREKEEEGDKKQKQGKGKEKGKERRKGRREGGYC